MNTFLASGRTGGLSHVLGKDVARLDTSHQHGADVARKRTHKVIRSERVRTTHRNSLLAAAGENRRSDDRLPVKGGQSVFKGPIQFQIVVKFEKVFRVQRFGQSHRAKSYANL